MFTALTHSQVWVLDHDEALDFYVGKLGFEVHTDVDLEFMRWLTINVPGQADREILLEIPGPPSLDPDTAVQVKDLLSKGAVGFSMGLTTDDCVGLYEELSGKGVEFLQAPVDRFYGIDMGLRDPFGNNIRITQPKPMMEDPATYESKPVA